MKGTRCGVLMAGVALAAAVLGAAPALATPSAAPDTTAPTAEFRLLPTKSLGYAFLPFQIRDSGSGPASYEARYRRLARNGSAYTPYAGNPDWSGHPTANKGNAWIGLPLSAGSTYCFSVRGTDVAGNVGPWRETCTTAVTDDRIVSADRRWSRTDASAYGGTLTTTSSAGARLTLAVAGVRSISLLAPTGPGFGAVTVTWNGKPLRTVSLRSASSFPQRLIKVADFTRLSTGTLGLVTTSSGKVMIDGWALRGF